MSRTHSLFQVHNQFSWRLQPIKRKPLQWNSANWFTQEMNKPKGYSNVTSPRYTVLCLLGSAPANRIAAVAVKQPLCRTLLRNAILPTSLQNRQCNATRRTTEDTRTSFFSVSLTTLAQNISSFDRYFLNFGPHARKPM
jgi:hypothetical protein